MILLRVQFPPAGGGEKERKQIVLLLFVFILLLLLILLLQNFSISQTEYYRDTQMSQMRFFLF